jgi:hypothetical protein
MAQHLIQAYQQAPWRLQVQRIRTFLLVILIGALIAGMYLYISAQAAVTGLKIQDAEDRRDVLMREISTNYVQLSALKSVANMEARAAKAGYKEASPNKGMYVMVPGYYGRPAVNLAPPPGPDMLPVDKLKPEYTQSLWELLFQTVNGLQLNQGGQQP